MCTSERTTMAWRLLMFAVLLSAADLGIAGMWDNLKIDCGVSVWTDWNSSGNGVLTRNRTVLRQPQNGGARCPPSTETDTDPWTIKDPKTKARNIARTLVSGTRCCASCDTIRPRDFLYVVDMSGSIRSAQFTLAKTKLSELIGKICGDVGLGQPYNRVAAITFSNFVTENFDFDTYSSTAAVQEAVLKLPYKSGRTCTGTALNYAQTMFDASKGARPDLISDKEVVLLTDGMANCGPDQLQAALRLRGLPQPKTLFVFAIGNNFDKDKITATTSSPPSGHLFSFINFIEFEKVVNEVLQYPANCAPIQVGK